MRIGLVVVIGSVIGGYLGAGGHLEVLWQPFEYVIIFGAALGESRCLICPKFSIARVISV